MSVMNKIALFFAMVACLGLGSCKKCIVCTYDGPTVDDRFEYCENDATQRTQVKLDYTRAGYICNEE